MSAQIVAHGAELAGVVDDHVIPDPQVGAERVHEHERALPSGIFVPEMKHLVIEQAEGHKRSWPRSLVMYSNDLCAKHNRLDMDRQGSSWRSIRG